VLDLYARIWDGQPPGEGEYVICADEKTSIQALATVWLAYLALGKARETVNEAREARQDAEKATLDAAAERRAAAADRSQAAADRRSEERDRKRRRLERVGELVEDLFWAADLARRGGKVAADTWMSQRNLLGHALVGLQNCLPESVSLVNCTTVGQAFETASRARQEVQRELDKLADAH
jgi:hypothetical protein